MYQENHLAMALRAASVGREDAVFLRDQVSDTTITYGTFWSNAEKMAAALSDLGVSPGDRVAVQCEKTVEMLELYVGTVLAGAIFLPLNTAYTPSEVAYFLGDAQPAIFVCAPAARKRHWNQSPIRQVRGSF